MALAGDDKRRRNKAYYQQRQARTAARGDKKILVSFRAYESLIGRIQRLILEGLAGKSHFPYKDRNAAFNGILIRGLEAMKDDVPEIGEMMAYLDALNQITAMRTQRQEAFSLLAVTKDEVSDLLAIGDEVVAAQCYHATMDAVAKMPKTRWNDHLRESLEKAFPQLASAKVRGVRLKPAHRAKAKP
jgi:hypothetical protein